MRSSRPPLFWKRKFEPEVIVTCVRWYLRFCLSLRDLEELMAERGLAVDHTSIWRWVQTYGPEVNRRLHGSVKPKSSTWHMDETFVRIAGKWMYLFRAVDGHGQTLDLSFRDAGPRSRQAVPSTGIGQSAQPATARVRPRWPTKLSGCDSRTAGERSGGAALPSANPPILQ